ncbi:MAG: MurT ligase domain-containing protein [Eubacterium sp.]|nr:MurT ligase domain-containing protein [Eubacterium sp.]
MITVMLTARITALILRLFKKGATTLPGRLALKLKYNILTGLSKGVKIICVTGTNGKTTVCAMIEHALKKAGRSYIINGSGANMLSGVTTAFIMNSTLTGKCRSEFAILECDENSLPLITRYVDADIITVTNLFRDQLDRYGETDNTLMKIKEGIKNCPKAVIILNADDPVSYSLSTGIDNRVITFGADSDSSDGGIPDSRRCPLCGSILKYKSITVSQLGDFYCQRCPYRRRTPDYLISGISETGFLFNDELCSSALGGIYNLYNFGAAAAVISTLDAGDVQAICSFSGAFGRMERFSVGNNTALLLLVKNPAGLTACIKYVSRIKGDISAAFALNDNSADGRDVSWIWDSDFTPLKDNFKSVYTVGTRSLDMALRLKYDGITADKIIDGENYRQLIEIIKSADGDFIVFSTYTAMMKMRHLFIDAFGGKEFWKRTE